MAQTSQKGGTMPWGAVAGAVTDLGLGIVNAINAQDNAWAQIRLAREQFQHQKTQAEDAKKRYDTTLANQQKGINALGASFGEALGRATQKNALAQIASKSTTQTAQTPQTPTPKGASFGGIQGTSLGGASLGANPPQNTPQTPTTTQTPSTQTPHTNAHEPELPTQRM